jgi:integrase
MHVNDGVDTRMTAPETLAPDPEILPPDAPRAASPQPTADPSRATAIAIATRLARSHPVPDALLALLDGPLGGAVAEAAKYAGDSLAPATRRAYERDWAVFAAWCRSQGADPNALPIHPVLVAAYLGSLVPKIARSALNARIAAIAYHHRRRGHAWIPGHPAIRETLRGIGRQHGKPVRPAAALTSVEIKKLIATCAEDLPGLRDRALFLVGFAGAFRRSELVAIDFVHLRFEASGVVIHVPRSKRDQEGKGADVTLPRMRGDDTCPVLALQRWLTRAKIKRGPVFRSITTHGTLEGRLSADGVRKILLRRAELAKLKVHASERLSPHGLRAGFITEAYLAAAPDEQVMAHTRHADLSTMRGYRRRAKITADNPARLLDL